MWVAGLMALDATAAWRALDTVFRNYDRHPTFHQFLLCYEPFAVRIRHHQAELESGRVVSNEEARQNVRKLREQLGKIGHSV